MNKKVLGILAASAAVVGSAISAAPVRAVTQGVNVKLTVDEVLYLRTFDTVDLRITPGELATAQESDAQGTTDGTSLLNLKDVTVTTTSGTTVNKKVNELYAVYSNEDDARVQVRVTVDPTKDKVYLNNDTNEAYALMSVVGLNDDGARTNEAVEDDDFGTGEAPIKIGGVELKFDFKDDKDRDAQPDAGRYEGGRIVVEAISEGTFPGQ
ncbi:MAG: hypothetical protein MJK14_02710 [Rivularia sp. ALOHA_DT_140]|nr:hypothetical protein [Rivularia sp. ALOHA_DT_140]